MSFRTFILSLSASFGVAWLAIVIVPYFKMRAIEPAAIEEGEGTGAVFIPKRAGRIADGAEVYAENGCYQCHTQLVRPTYAGNDMFRPDWGGIAADEDRGDTRRETNAFDFGGEKFAQIGVTRIGPDLSNLGRRVEAIYAKGLDPEQWIYRHLYNPRWEPIHRDSSCPSVSFLFDVRELKGNPSDEALPFPVGEGMEITPKPEARALASYLLSLKKDQSVPAFLNFAPPAAEAPAPAETAPAAPAP
jgi:cytochrome c oxidase cbb3-type subunit 2